MEVFSSLFIYLQYVCTECSQYYYAYEGANAALWTISRPHNWKLPWKITCSLGKSVAEFAEMAEEFWQDLTTVEGACVSMYERGLFFECL
jgi:hypothetical protein